MSRHLSSGMLGWAGVGFSPSLSTFPLAVVSLWKILWAGASLARSGTSLVEWYLGHLVISGRRTCL